MHKTMMKLLSVGAVIILLLAMMLITNGCQKEPVGTDVPTTTRQVANAVGTISDDWTEDTFNTTDETTQDTTGETTGDTETTADETTGETAQQPQTQDGGVSYADYLAMTPEQQKTFYESFSSMDAWIAWIEAAKAAHQDSNEDNTFTIGTDPINLEDLLGIEP